MAIRSPGKQPGKGVGELRLPGRAVAALARAGITDVADLAVLTRRDLSAVPGLGPSTIAAIRAVVPEPPARLPQTAETLPLTAADPATEDPATGDDATEDDAPPSPSIPSFASLRSPQRRTALDLLVPETPTDPPPPDPRSDPSPSEPAPPAATGSPSGGPRPAEWADLWRFGLRVARWWVQQPPRALRRLLG